jgi:hypothetical protein
MSTLGEVRHMSPGSVSFNRSSGYFQLNAPQLMRISEVREVTAVLVLYGLPEELVTSIIAHEAMHVWLKLSHHIPFHLPSKVEEGLCQVISHKYLQKVGEQRTTGPSNALTDRAFEELRQSEALRSYLCYQIEKDTNPVYGDGFREADKCVNALGLQIVLDCIRDDKALPPV